MKHLDKFEQLAYDAVVSAGVLANPEGTDGALVCGDLDEPTRRDLTARGFAFAGCIGLMADGTPRTALAQPIEPEVITALAKLFTVHVVPQFLEKAKRPAQPKDEPKAADDSEAWLWRLWALKDERTEA